MNQQQPAEPRLPQIDPITFGALNSIDSFLARAPLTRQEHAEANKSMQHLVQTLEMLQAALRQMNGGHPPSHAQNKISATPPGVTERGENSGNGGGRIVAEVAEEIFRNAK